MHTQKIFIKLKYPVVLLIYSFKMHTRQSSAMYLQ